MHSRSTGSARTNRFVTVTNTSTAKGTNSPKPTSPTTNHGPSPLGSNRIASDSRAKGLENPNVLFYSYRCG